MMTTMIIIDFTHCLVNLLKMMSIVNFAICNLPNKITVVQGSVLLL